MTPSTRPIRFFHRGQTVAVEGVAPTKSVLNWLREDAHCSGTKEGCNEGDCGACTVIVAELSDRLDAIGGLHLATVNACLQLLPTLDGKALLTVDDLAAADGTLHPAQQALVDCHGSQCGFCTPGFAVSLAACHVQHQAHGTRPSRGELADALAGNLCRCTGYRPILDAGTRMFDIPARPLDTAPIVAALRALQADPPLAYEAVGLDGCTPERFDAPRTIDALAALRAARPQAQLLAGSTDIGLWITKQFRPVHELVFVGRVDALRHIGWEGDVLRIGAGASLEDAWQALVGIAPSLTELWRRFAGPPVRHAGTLGGNVANGSPIGDGAPVLLALDATLLLRLGGRQRRVPLDGFYLGYMRNQLEPGEFIEAIEVPRPAVGSQLRAYKLSKRFDCDISAVCAGLAVEIGDDGVVRSARFAFGGMAAVVKRAAAAEAAVVGRAWTRGVVEDAMACLAEDFQPLDDLRASRGYRMRAARGVLMRFWMQTGAGSVVTDAETSVWAVV